MSHFILHTNARGKIWLRYLAAAAACIALAGSAWYLVHRIGTAGAKSRETVLIYTDGELEQYLLNQESEDYNLDGNYRLEADLDLGWVNKSIGNNLEPFTGKLDGNGHVISNLGRPLFGVMEKAEVKNLFLNGVMVNHPFTYHDGTRYVDGYGALAAYVIDSNIQNCGMSGEIRMASPAQAEYLVAKASPAEADEERGPGTEGVSGTNENIPETSPALEDVEHGESSENHREHDVGEEKGPGVETDAAPDSSETQEIGPGIEAVETEETTGDGEQASTENSTIESESQELTSAAQGDEAGKPEPDSGSDTAQKETTQANPSQTADSDEESEESIKETIEDGNAESLEEDDAGTSGEADSKPEADESGADTFREAGGKDSGKVESNIAETIGLRANDRQYLLMKIPEVIGPGQEEISTASPSNATPADASDIPTEPSISGNVEEEISGEPEYTGSPAGEIFILVTADRITAGGLAAEIVGETLMIDSFALVTIDSSVAEVEAYTGGITGIVGNGSRMENSYASGLADASGVTGGFAARNEGTIQNSYSSMTIGRRGRGRGAFIAEGNGVLYGCVYDRQIACVEGDGYEGNPDDLDSAIQPSTPSETLDQMEMEADFHLKGLNTVEMTGTSPGIPGSWYTADQAYPQIEYFALQEQEIISACSKASAIALALPDGQILTDILKEGEVRLPQEIDGREILWEAEGNIRINEDHEIVTERAAEISRHESPNVGSSWIASPYDAEEESSSENQDGREEIQLPQEGERLADGEASLTASVGGVAKRFALNAVAPAAATYTSWGQIAQAVETGGELAHLQPKLASDGFYEVGTPEALAWLAYKINADTALRTSKIRLTADLDLFGVGYNTKTFDPAANNIEDAFPWYSITTFSGIFDGGGHAVYNMYLNTARDGLGFFYYLEGEDVVIKNFGIGSGKIINGHLRAGGIVGYARCLKGGKVSKITNCWNNASVTSDATVGGIIGYVIEGTYDLEGCYNLGTITATGGKLDTGSFYGGGGIVGKAYGAQGNVKLNIKNCYNVGTITGTIGTGGIFGGRTGSSATVSVQNCYNVGNVSGTGETGSIIGHYQDSADGSNNYYLNTKLADQYATPVSDANLKTWYAAYALNGQKMKQDGEISWTYDPNGIKYPVIGELPNLTNWDQVVKGMETGLITAEPLSSTETGSPDKPYHIKSAEQLAQFAYRVNKGQPGLCAELGADINLFGAAYTNIAYDPNDSTMKTKALHWIPIGNNGISYTGTFNGNDHTVSLMNVRDTAGVSPYGLFGTVAGNGKVGGVGIEESVISGRIIGGIAGSLEQKGEISRCFIRESTSFVFPASGGAYCGGITGYMWGDSSIKDCYSREMSASGGGGAGSYAGGIVGWMTDNNGVYNSYAFQADITLPAGTSKGSIAGGQSKTGTIHQCYVDTKMANGDSDPGIAQLVLPDQTDAQIQQQVVDLNTMNGVERTGTDRAWYTSLAVEKTGGLPTLEAPQILTAEVNPADVIYDASGSLTGSKGALAGAALPADTRLRGICREKSSDLEFTLTAASEIMGNYRKYGSDNANKNLVLMVGNKELQSLTPSLTAPGDAAQLGTFADISLFVGAAYTHPTDRVLLIDLVGDLTSGKPTRYELQLTVKGITGKTLSVVLGTPGKIELQPGKASEAFTQDLSLENRCDYPLLVNIASVTMKAKNAGTIDVELKPTTAVDPEKSLVGQGIRLGIAKPAATDADTGGIGNQKFYYIPPVDGTSAPSTAKWMTSQIEGNQILNYRYFMEYSHVYLGPGDEKFGYDINYQFEIPKADVNGIQVSAN